MTLSANREASFKNRNKLLQAVLPLKNVQIQAVFSYTSFLNGRGKIAELDNVKSYSFESSASAMAKME